MKAADGRIGEHHEIRENIKTWTRRKRRRGIRVRRD